MTDISAIGTHADLQLGSVNAPSPPTPLLPNGASSHEGAVPDELSSTIKCICGYNDDDGNTVLCEICNTWQHIECYYPDQKVPEVHECHDCNPRGLDRKGANERQKQLRELQIFGDRRVRRPTTKSHKKKTKDSIVTNGWPVTDRADSAERPSGSPREQPPPTKRPKTSHKASTSVASVSQVALAANARRKHVTGNLSGQSPVKSPPTLTPNGYHGDYLSPEFMQLSQKSPYQHAEANSFTSIGLTNDLSLWLSDPDALGDVANGIDPRQVFWRPDRSFAELESIYPSLTKHAEEDKSISINGIHPTIEWLTVDSAMRHNALIGEIRGHIGRLEEYIQDSSNRWATLRHPEPFVFFPPHLPIVIDAREEGTVLRYIRRSCQPNAMMKILIDKGRDYHFCFVSVDNINEGDEITIKWDIDPAIHQSLAASLSNGNIKEGIHGEHEEYISNWASGVLANFGGCACRKPPGHCLLGRFDRRNQLLSPEAVGHALKPRKSRKGKKHLNHISPLSTGHATNSRASSEAAFHRSDQIDDRADSRSLSGSSRSKPTSRDNTPGANSVEAMVGLGVELSERERRKMQQIEKQFDAMDHTDNTGKKKKRYSAGSTLNTPSVLTSVSGANVSGPCITLLTNGQKQFGLIDSENPSPTLASSSKSFRSLVTNPNGINGNMRNSRNSSGNSQVQIQARPVYVDADTQTEMDREQFYSTQLASRKRKRAPYAERLLQRTREGRVKRARLDNPPASSRNAPPSPQAGVAASGTQTHSPSALQAPVASMLPPPKPAPQSPSVETMSRESQDAAPSGDQHDIDMEDAPPEPVPASKSAKERPEASGASDETPERPQEPPPASQAQADLPAPPWFEKPSSPASTSAMAAQTSDIPPVDTASSPPADEKPPAPTAPMISEPAKTPTEAEPTAATFASSTTSTRPHNLHVTLPPVPSFMSPTVSTPGSVTGGAFAQSPLSTTASIPGPLFSPAIQSAVAASPLKKKLSLSDYTNRKKKNVAVAAAKEAAAAAEKEKEAQPLPAVAEASTAEGDPSLSDKDKDPGSAIEEADMPLPPLRSAAGNDASSPMEDKASDDRSEATGPVSIADTHSDGKAETEGKSEPDPAATSPS